MLTPNEPARGIIIPFPIEAIRRPPAPAFVTQPVRAPRVPPTARFALACFAAASLVAAVLAGLLVLGAASRAARPAARRPGSAPGVAHRPSVPGSVNVLIAGLDADDATRDESGTRSDAVMLLHLDANREGAWLVSIPRDAWVSLPGHGENRIDTAYALGGPGLLVATLERLTRLRVDHLAVIDRTGVRRLTDGVGGVTLSLDSRGSDDAEAHGGGLALEMSGAMALDYVSARSALAHGDLDHIHREHRYVRALLSQLEQRGTLVDPPAMRDLASALGASVRVDAGLTSAALRSLLDSTKRIRPEDVTFVAAPVARARRSGERAPVPADDAGCAQLWDAIAHDEMAAFVDAHPELVTLDVQH